MKKITWMQVRAALLVAVLVLSGGSLFLLTRPAEAVTAKPLVWFNVDDDFQRQVKGFPTQNFSQLYTNPSQWQEGLAGVKIFGISELSALASPESQLRPLYAFLKAHNIALAISNAQMLPIGPNGCGTHIEGYTLNDQDLYNSIVRVQQLGGKVQYIDMDEPLLFGTVPVPGGCQYTVSQVTQMVKQKVAQIKQTFPTVQIGDSEVITGHIPAGVNITVDQWNARIGQWIDTYTQTVGQPLAFFHADIAWSQPIQNDNLDWGPSYIAASNYLAARNIPIGIFYNGDTDVASTSAAWVQTAIDRYTYIETLQHIIPQHGIIYSWELNPTALLPESQSSTMTYFLRQYVRHIKTL